MNGDGLLDVVSAGPVTSILGAAIVHVFLGTGKSALFGTAEFQLASDFVVDGDDPRSVALGRLTCDAHTDLVTVNESNVSVPVGDGAGNFTPAVGSPAGRLVAPW